MDIIPPVRAARFEQLEPGELFIYVDGERQWYAIKTRQPSDGDRSAMVLLGPEFLPEARESFLLEWQPTTVLSLGKNYHILPSLDPTSWFANGPTREPVCLAVANEKIYICTNGSRFPQRYLPYFVEAKTGEVIEGRLPGLAVFTSVWEIALLSPEHPPRSVLKYPLL